MEREVKDWEYQDPKTKTIRVVKPCPYCGCMHFSGSPYGCGK